MSDEKRKNLSWAKALPSSYWSKLAAKTERRLSTKKQRAPAWSPTPAWSWSVAASSVIAVVLAWPSRPTPPSEIPVELVAQLDLAEHLELMEDWEMIEALVPDKEPS